MKLYNAKLFFRPLFVVPRTSLAIFSSYEPQGSFYIIKDRFTNLVIHPAARDLAKFYVNQVEKLHLVFDKEILRLGQNFNEGIGFLS